MIGQMVGHYRVEEKLGAGGMGTVYRATDTKLGREVAIKVLPEAFAKDSSRLQRFEREARLLASLNHPNIAAIYGFEESGGLHYLVLELVPGKTLAERLRMGPLPLDRALQICGQVAEALEAAHEKSIVHRDLKPDNIKVTPEGKVKVLDFGIAKSLMADTDTAEDSQAVTRTMGRTAGHVVLGTGPYLSPEQARGETVSKRADIWGLGCVMFETLTGRRAFAGATTFETVAAVLHQEPDWELLPESLPPNIRVLLRRCLRKEPSQRLRDAGDALIEIQDTLAELKPAPLAVAAPDSRPVTTADGDFAPAVTPPAAPAATVDGASQVQPGSSAGHRLWLGIVVVLVIAAGASAWWWLRRASPGPAPTAPASSAAPVFSGHTDGVLGVTVEPAGKRVASASGDNTVKIWELATGQGLQTLAGFKGKVNAVGFSPDGRWLAAGGEDRLVSVWDRDLKPAATLQGHAGPINALAFSPDSRWIASAGADLGVKVWEVSTWQHARTLRGHTDWVRAVAFSPDGRLLASAGDDRTVKVWEAAGGNLAQSIEGHARGISSLAFSRDGRLLASGTWESVHLWDLAAGKQQATLSGHKNWVLALAFAPDGRTLASASGDLLVKLWDISKAAERRTLAGHTRGVSSIAFSPDGRFLVSGSGDQTLKVWEAASGKDVRTLGIPR